MIWIVPQPRRKKSNVVNWAVKRLQMTLNTEYGFLYFLWTQAATLQVPVVMDAHLVVKEAWRKHTGQTGVWWKAVESNPHVKKAQSKEKVYPLNQSPAHFTCTAISVGALTEQKHRRVYGENPVTPVKGVSFTQTSKRNPALWSFLLSYWLSRCIRTEAFPARLLLQSCRQCDLHGPSPVSLVEDRI